MTLIDIRMPKYPECWESCGNCGSGDVLIDEVCVQVGDLVEIEDTLIILETGKVALDIPSPKAGVVTDVFVSAGQKIKENALIIQLTPV